MTFSLAQMKLSTDEFRSLASRYADLYQSSFDADSATLRNVELYPLGQRRTRTKNENKLRTCYGYGGGHMNISDWLVRACVCARVFLAPSGQCLVAGLKSFGSDGCKRAQHEQSPCAVVLSAVMISSVALFTLCSLLLEPL